MQVQLVMRESRGDGDVINIIINNKESVAIKDRCIKVDASDGVFYMFMLHNVLYYIISDQTTTDVQGYEDFSGNL